MTQWSPSEKAVGVYIDTDAHLGIPIECREPVTDHFLDIEAPARVHQKAWAVPAAEHGKRSGRRAEDGHAVYLGCGRADAPRNGLGF